MGEGRLRIAGLAPIPRFMEDCPAIGLGDMTCVQHWFLQPLWP